MSLMSDFQERGELPAVRFQGYLLWDEALSHFPLRTHRENAFRQAQGKWKFATEGEEVPACKRLRFYSMLPAALFSSGVKKYC